MFTSATKQDQIGSRLAFLLLKILYRLDVTCTKYRPGEK